MKIVQINATCGIGSTGKICTGISKMLSYSNIENYILYSSNKSDFPLGIKCASNKYIKFQALKSRLKGNYGFNSNYSTKNIIDNLEMINPDIIHIHNIHGHDCNLKKLFLYLKSKKKKIVWTFHDCWTFTAYCPYFTMAKCNKWKTGCNSCVLRKQYSYFFDRSEWLYEQKRYLFSGLDLTIVTPSQWLADLVKQSFLKDYPIKVINNGIDLNIFKPTPSSFREKFCLQDKIIVLGVAFGWGKRKGLDVFEKLSNLLDNRYQIVLVGTDKNIDKQLPNNIISIHRTQNQKELAEIYSSADVFVNPTREDNFPTVNIEALACGTPVVTFDSGGSPECTDETCGIVVPCNDLDTLIYAIEKVCNTKPFSTDNCLNRAQKFDMYEKFAKYINLYGDLC